MNIWQLLPINNEELLIRKFTDSDAEALANIEYDSSVKKYLSLPAVEKTDWVKRFKGEQVGSFALEHNGCLVGRGGLDRYEKGCLEITILIGLQYQRLGLGKKFANILVDVAFNRLNAKAIVAVVHPENLAMINLLRALEFQISGTLINANYHWQEGHLIYRLFHGRVQ